MTLHPIFAEIIDGHLRVTKAVTSRLAKCRCGRTEPSSDRSRLFGFTDKSLDSDWSRKCCRHCGKYEVAHHPGCSAVAPDKYERHPFDPRNEAAEFDSYYCGCGGWE